MSKEIVKVTRAEFMKREADSLEITVEDLEEYFSYLEVLRESGVTNMYGATPYLERDCGLPKNLARKVLSCWMRSYSEIEEEK